MLVDGLADDSQRHLEARHARLVLGRGEPSLPRHRQLRNLPLVPPELGGPELEQVTQLVRWELPEPVMAYYS